MIGSKTWHPEILQERTAIAFQVLWNTLGPMPSEGQTVSLIVSTVAGYEWSKELNPHGFAAACGAVADELDRLRQIMQHGKWYIPLPPDLHRLAMNVMQDPELRVEGEIALRFTAALNANPNTPAVIQMTP
jgi:hypothetical protein